MRSMSIFQAWQTLSELGEGGRGGWLGPPLRRALFSETMCDHLMSFLGVRCREDAILVYKDEFLAAINAKTDKELHFK